MRTIQTASLAVAALALLLVVIGCTPPVVKPTITISHNAPGDSIATSGTVNFTATVTPAAATVAWTATGGSPTTGTGTTFGWTAPSTPGNYTITAIATNGTEHDTAAKTIKVYAAGGLTWLYDEVEYDNIDEYVIPNPGTTYSPIRFPDDEWVHPGALVESVSVAIDINYGGDPDSVPTMNIWVEAPDGARVKIRNETQSGDPTGEYPSDLFVAFRDKPVNGTWKLVVQALEPSPVVGTIDDFYLTVKYRYRP